MSAEEKPVLLSQVAQKLVGSLNLPVVVHADTGPALSSDERHDLGSCELWKGDMGWSNEAGALREVAVKTPEKLTPGLVRDAIRTLRIVDKQVTEVDEGLVRCYPNLEELTLTGNHLKTINPNHLPPQLKVLELCYNQLTGLEELNQCTSQLLHLGVGFNRITQLYLHPSHWSSLLSLDVSHNQLSDLPSLTRGLAQLPRLRNLLLVDNPLTLVPCYRGYVVDSLGSLSCLDDVEVTVNERRQVDGMKGHCDRHNNLITSAHFELQVTDISGLPALTNKGSADTDDQLTRYLLQLTHTFLLESRFSRLEQNESGERLRSQLLKILHNDDDASQPTTGFSEQYFRPVIYSPENSDYSTLVVLYAADELHELKSLLEQGIELKVLLQKVTFVKDESKRLPSAKDAKSGRTTAQSGRSSASKKPEKKAPKGKCKGQPPPDIPGEGWCSSNVESFPLGVCHLDTSPLLANEKHSLNIDASVPVSDAACRQLLELQQDDSNNTIALSIEVVLKEYTCTSDIPNNLCPS